MKNVIIDSCVFFHMLKANKVYMESGIYGLEEYINMSNQSLKALKDTISELMTDDFVKNNKKGQTKFSNVIDSYKTYIRSNLANAKRAIVSMQNLLEGKVVGKDGKVKTIEVTPERKLQWQEKLDEATSNVNLLSKNIELFDKLAEEYKNIYQPNVCANLYKNMVNGNVQFSIVGDSYREILNHTKENATNSDTFKYFNPSDVYSLLNECVLLTTDSTKTLKDIDMLSEQYRTRETKNESCMDGDINSLKVYGDSRIMAEASIAGYDFVTLNEKDFITDKSKKLGNDFIRQHIQKVNKQNESIATNIGVYAPHEINKILDLSKNTSIQAVV